MSFYAKKKKKKGSASKRTAKRRRSVVELDRLTRALVFDRDNYACVRCGNTAYLTPSHVYPKGTFGNLRWVLDNLKTLCISCHRCWHLNPVEMSDWWRKKYPERYEALCLSRHTAPKPDIAALVDERTKEVGELSFPAGRMMSQPIVDAEIPF